MPSDLLAVFRENETCKLKRDAHKNCLVGTVCDVCMQQIEWGCREGEVSFSWKGSAGSWDRFHREDDACSVLFTHHLFY